MLRTYAAATVALLFLMVPVTAHAAAPNAVDDEAATFLLQSMRVRTTLARGTADHKTIADRYWKLASRLAEAVSDTGENDLYLPVLKGFNDSLETDVLSGDTVNLANLAILQKSLAEQVQILGGFGIFSGTKKGIDVEVRARDAKGEKVDGLYVWLDLICCSRSSSTSNALPAVTSPSQARIIPGTYLIRLRDATKEITRREALLGGSGKSKEVVDILIP